MVKHFAAALLCTAALAYGAEVPAGIPKDATEVSRGLYRATDKDGKVWLYRKTPFGVQKAAEEAVKARAAERAAAAPKEPASGVIRSPFGQTKVETDASSDSKAAPVSSLATKVVEEGDSLRFERRSPFGVTSWTRKKSELTEQEKRIWQAQGSASASTDKK